MYEYIRKDWVPAASAMFDAETSKHIFAHHEQHELMIREWNKVFNMHKTSPPSWDAFKTRFGKYEQHHQGAPQDAPTGKELYARAQ